MAEFIVGSTIVMVLLAAPYFIGLIVSDYDDDGFEIWIKGFITIIIIAAICGILYGIGTVALHILNR